LNSHQIIFTFLVLYKNTNIEQKITQKAHKQNDRDYIFQTKISCIYDNLILQK